MNFFNNGWLYFLVSGYGDNIIYLNFFNLRMFFLILYKIDFFVIKKVGVFGIFF